VSRVAQLRNRVAPVPAGLVLGVMVVVLWWWWPHLARDPERIDVVVVADGQVHEASDPLERRIRESGRSVRTLTQPMSWCEAVDAVASAVEELSPSSVVVSVRAIDPSCDGFDAADGDGWEALRRAAVPARLVVIVQPGPVPLGQTPEVLATLRSGDGWIVSDPTELLGEAGEERLPCQWWDDCEADGAIAIRDSGRLTTAGGERVARVTAAVLP
jgi:hypothetical protein